MSIARELRLEKKAALKSSKKELESKRAHLKPTKTGALPPVLLPEEIDGTWQSGFKVYMDGRYDPADELQAVLLESGLMTEKDLPEEERRKLKAKKLRKPPRVSRFYNELYKSPNAKLYKAEQL